MKILNGEVYDPSNGINGEIRDIYIQDGRVVDHDAGLQLASPCPPLSYFHAEKGD